MKANELMIGDWVYAKLNPNRKEPRQIENIYGELFNAEIWYGYEIQGGYKLTDATPIPLTPEILEMNEWKQEDKLWKSKEIDSVGQEFIIELGYYGHPFVSTESEYRERLVWHVKYVHQLQQALRFCGLTDLADSLKV